MRKGSFLILFLTIVGGGLPKESLADDCVARALEDARAECLRLCPTACKEPLNWAPGQSSVEVCEAACMDFCSITSTEEITHETPWIRAETLRDFHQRKAACEGQPVKGPTPWQSVDPVASATTP